MCAITETKLMGVARRKCVSQQLCTTCLRVARTILEMYFNVFRFATLDNHKQLRLPAHRVEINCLARGVLQAFGVHTHIYTSTTTRTSYGVYFAMYFYSVAAVAASNLRMRAKPLPPSNEAVYAITSRINAIITHCGGAASCVHMCVLPPQ